MDNDFEYAFLKPNPIMQAYVDGFWRVQNHSEAYKDIVIVPDGRVDLFFSYGVTEPFHTTLMGLESEPTSTAFPPKTVIYAISFKLLAVEYLLHTSIADMLDGAREMPVEFWNISKEDINDFDHFCNKVSNKIKGLLNMEIDSRKLHLFDLIYTSNGSLSVKELSEKVFWSSRQINRYFNQQFGMPLKAYCNILRFRASFQHIKEGKLFPEQNFTDQAHFIKQVKKLSGVVPKELSRNKNGRFLQFLSLPQK